MAAFRRKTIRKRNYAKANIRKPKAKVSKPLRKAIKQVMKSEIETKTINITDPDSGLIRKNTINKIYTAGMGLQYLAHDVFSCPQGVEDNSALWSPNRIGDKVRAVGFRMNYYIHSRNNYAVAAQTYVIPFIKVRILVFRAAFGLPVPIYSTVYNNNFLQVNTYTLQPVDFHEGYVKEVLYDKIVILKANQLISTDSVSIPNSQFPYTNVYHLNKYIKYDKVLKYMDDNTTTPNGTDKPIYIAMSAEIDDSFSGLTPSGTALFYTTGYTQAWFKDA